MRATIYYSTRGLLLLLAVIGVNCALLRAGTHIQGISKDETASVESRVRQLLADERLDDDEVSRAIFEIGNGAVPTLIAALQQDTNVARAARSLAYLGGSEERRALIRTIDREKDSERRLIVSSLLAGSLVRPASRDEWDFLKKSIRVRNQHGSDDFILFSATLALGMNGSARALQLLESARAAVRSSDTDSDLAKAIDNAIRWVKHSSANKRAPSHPSGSDLEEITRCVLQSAFYTDRESGQPSIQKVVFTKDKMRALVTVEVYHSSKEAQGYDIVLQRTAGAWRIVGIWFTWTS